MYKEIKLKERNMQYITVCKNNKEIYDLILRNLSFDGWTVVNAGMCYRSNADIPDWWAVLSKKEEPVI